ncbi:YceD family protein [Indiicoccus explosivorum]|uniref:YceD family protein n=1 Tax=Indiicoccus explosivorum TaxID=1917864 RepID=UPI000B44B00D|nr:YceD family protein [Indiicoccus explosivorum]
MKWSVMQLQKHQRNGMELDETVRLDEVMDRNSEIRAISPVHVTGHCDIGSKKMTCHLRLEGVLILPCAKTWEDVELPFNIRSDEIFEWGEYADESEDENVHAVEGDVIDLQPVLEELILLEIPLQVFREGADDVVIEGGADWSYKTEDQLREEAENEKPKTDPRLAGLAKFFDQSEE